MKNFFIYFFGQGTEEEFKNFSLAHLIPILVAAGVIYLIFRYSDKLRDWKYEGKLRMGIAFAMIICEMSYFWRLVGVEKGSGCLGEYSG